MELEEKYLVLKWSDIGRAIMPYELSALRRIIKRVGEYRADHGKPPNSYVVINQDEPYFPDVLKLMEQAEQAPRSAEDTARRRSQAAKDGCEIRRARQTHRHSPE